MAMVVLATLFAIFISLLFRVAYDSISCYWLTPRRIKKIMNKQGVRGPKPRGLTGNILEMASLISQSTSKDMGHIHHDIVGRLLPHYATWSEQYGIHFFTNMSCFNVGNLWSETFMFCSVFLLFRKEVYILAWDWAEDVYIRDWVNQGTSDEIQHQGRKIMAATARIKTFYRQRSVNGER